MTDTKQETKLPDGMTDDAWMNEWEKVVGKPEPDDEPEKSVVKSDTLSVDGAENVLQVEPDESPAGEPDQTAVESAMTELRRAGLSPDAFKGKSEGALLVAMGEALNTVRRDQDRRIQELKAAQGSPTDSSKSDQGEIDTVPASGDASAKQAPSGPTVDLQALSSVLLDDGLSEEAAQSVVSVIESLAKQNAALEARLNADVQARQLAPLEQAITEETAGIEALSNPEKLDSFLTMAKAKAEFDGIELGKDPVEAARRIIRNALGTEGRPAQATKVRTSKPATAKGKATPDKPRNRDERFDELSTEFFRANFPEHL